MAHSTYGNLLSEKTRSFLKKNRRTVSIAIGIFLVLTLVLKNNSSQTKPVEYSSNQSEPITKQSPFYIPDLIRISENGNLEFAENRHFKEQIEKDLTSFSFVEAAKAAVVFNEADPNLSKVSLIISPGKETKTLTRREIHSIVNHLRGIIGNLPTENISISDHRGLLYRTDLPDQRQIVQINIENTVSELLSSYFRGIIPPKHCLFKIRSETDLENKVQIHLDILLNSTFLKRLSSKSQDSFTKNILEKSKTLIQREGALPFVSLEILPFFSEDHEKSHPRKLPRGMIVSIYFITIGACISLAYLYLFNKKTNVTYFCPRNAEEKKDMHLKKLASLLSNQTPEKIKLILSYLDERHAKTLTSFLPTDVQNALNREA